MSDTKELRALYDEWRRLSDAADRLPLCSPVRERAETAAGDKYETLCRAAVNALPGLLDRIKQLEVESGLYLEELHAANAQQDAVMDALGLPHGDAPPFCGSGAAANDAAVKRIEKLEAVAEAVDAWAGPTMPAADDRYRAAMRAALRALDAKAGAR